jgi:hypothetical protein
MNGFEFLPQINPTSIFTAGTFAAIVVTLIKTWPVISLQVMKAKEKLRAEDRSDLSDCKERLDAMGLRMDAMFTQMNNLKIELAGVLSAYRILEVAEERRSPKSIHLAQARALLSSVFTVAPSTIEFPGEPKSPTLRAAEVAEFDAEQTCTSTREARQEVERSEGEDKPD